MPFEFSPLINICNDKMEGLVTSGTKNQMTYIRSDERPIQANQTSNITFFT